MPNSYETNQHMHPGSVNGVKGTWVPVDKAEAPASVSKDPYHPSLGENGEYYYSADVTTYRSPAPVDANLETAIPAPSNIVQLPPIVQPIAMVPYTTQNQPLVQYDPNYRPPIEKTVQSDPVYRRKPYAAISAVMALFALAFIVLACAMPLYKELPKGDEAESAAAPKAMTAVEAVKNLIEPADGKDYIHEIAGTGNYEHALNAAMPALIALAMLFCLIIAINALVKLGRLRPLAKFNAWAFLALLFTGGCVAIGFLKKDRFKIETAMYAAAGLAFLMLALPLFINRKAHVLDYVRSKQTYIAR